MQLIFIRLLDMYFLMNLKSLDLSFNQNMSLDKKAVKITLWSLFMDRVPLPQGYRNKKYMEDVALQ